MKTSLRVSDHGGVHVKGAVELNYFVNVATDVCDSVVNRKLLAGCLWGVSVYGEREDDRSDQNRHDDQYGEYSLLGFDFFS